MTGLSLAATLHLTFFAVARKVSCENLRLPLIYAQNFSVTSKKKLMQQCCSAALSGENHEVGCQILFAQRLG